MNTKKTKRFAVIVSLLLAVSVVVSGLTVFADTKTDDKSVSSVSEQTTETEADSLHDTEPSTEASVDTSVDVGDEGQSSVPADDTPVESATPEESDDGMPEDTSKDSGAIKENEKQDPPATSKDVVLGESATITIQQPDFAETSEDTISVVDKETGAVISTGDKILVGKDIEITVSNLPYAMLVINDEQHAVEEDLSFVMDYTVTKDTLITAKRAMQTLQQRSGVTTQTFYWENVEISVGNWEYRVHRTITYADGNSSSVQTKNILDIESTVTTRVNSSHSGTLALEFPTADVTSHLKLASETSGTEAYTVGGVTIAGGGSVDFNGKTPTGAVTVNAGGVVTDRTGTLTMGGQTLTVNGASGLGAKVSSTGTVNLKGTDLTKDVTASTVNLNGVTIGSGTTVDATTINTSGKVTLNGTFKGGALVVQSGTLKKNEAGTIMNTGKLTLTGTYNGTGTIPQKESTNGLVSSEFSGINFNNGTIALGEVCAKTIDSGYHGVISGILTLTEQNTDMELNGNITGGGTLSIKGTAGVTIINDTGDSGGKLAIETVGGKIHVTKDSTGSTNGYIRSATASSGDVLVDNSGAVSGSISAGGTVVVKDSGTVGGDISSFSAKAAASDPAIFVDTSGVVSAGKTIKASSGYVYIKKTGNDSTATPSGQISRVEGNKVQIDAGHTAGVGTISSKNGVILNATTGSYNVVYAGGHLAPIDGSNQSSIGLLYAGSDTAEVAISTFTVENWDIGTFLLGGNGFDVTGDITLAIDGTIGGAANLIPNGFAGEKKAVYLGGANESVAANKTVTYTIDGETILGNFYGGGISGDVGNIMITMTSGTIGGNFYGGGKTGTVGDVSVTLNDGTIGGNFYGGGEAGTVGDVIVALNDGTIGGNFYGGGKTGTVGDVSVTLNDGTIGGNFYGGGEAGTVGDVTATLTDGAINGTEGVFGSGTGGSVASVNLTVNKDLLTEDTAAFYGGGAGGSVVGKVDVAINNNTTHDIYGGGTGGTSTVGAGTEIKLGESTEVTVTNVYGGGMTGAADSTNVSGGTKIQFYQGKATNIYGGGSNATVAGGTEIIAGETKAVSVTGNIYGGGIGSKASVSGGTQVTLHQGSAANVYGGGETATTTGGTKVVLGDKAAVNISNDVYGGGQGTEATVTGDTSVTLHTTTAKNVHGGGSAANVTGTTTVTIGTVATDPAKVSVVDNVYGGSNGGNVNTTSGTANVIISKGSSVKEYVFGGSIDGSAEDTVVTVSGTVGKDIYGGGKGATSTTADTAVTLTTDGTVTAGSVYGGGYEGTSNDTVVSVGGTVTNGEVYGGGNNGIVNSTNVTVTGSVNGDIYGGGETGNVEVDTVVLFQGQGTGTDDKFIHSIYGGAKDADVGGKTTVTIEASVHQNGQTGAAENNVYGGGKNGSVINANLTVDNNATVETHVFGGGRNGEVENKATVNIKSGTTVGVNEDDKYRHVYGGSYQADTGQTDVTVAGTVHGHVYGSGLADGGAGKTGSTVVKVSGELTPVVDAADKANPLKYKAGNVYGGSDMEVEGNTKVTIQTGASVSFVFGGGETGTVGVANAGTAQVFVEGGTVSMEVYGGGANAKTQKTEVSITDGTLQGNIHGGGFSTEDSKDAHAVEDSAEVLVNGGTIAKGINVYGGGNGGIVKGKATVSIGKSGSTLTTFSGTYNEQNNIFGGGTDNFAYPASTGSTAVNYYGAATDENPFHLYGGGENSKIINSVVVTMYSGTIDGNLYGGGFNGAINTEDNEKAIDITIETGANIIGRLYGAGVENKSNTPADTEVKGNIAIDMKGTITGVKEVDTGNTSDFAKTTADAIDGALVGGGRNNVVDGDISISLSGSVSNGSVFGGGDNGNALAQGSTDAIVGKTQGRGNVTIALSGKVIEGSVFGGGNMPQADVQGDVEISTADNFNVYQDIFGGGHQANIGGTTTIEIFGGDTGVEENIYGGGYRDAEIKNNESKTNASTVTIYSAAPQKNVFGGGRRDATTNGSTLVTLKAAGGKVTDTVYGGGRDTSIVNGNTRVVLEGSAVPAEKTSASNVYGGGLNGSPVTGNTAVEVSGNVLAGTGDNGHVFGGGTKGQDTAGSPVNGETKVTIKDTAIIDGNVYGGGEDESNVGKSATVIVQNKAAVNLNVYGGGITQSNIGENTVVVVKDASVVSGNVYGGGIDSSDVELDASVTVSTDEYVDGSVYGGGDKNSKIKEFTSVTITGKATVKTNVYGGGIDDSDVSEYTKVLVDDNATVDFDVFGGGIDHSDVGEYASVTVSTDKKIGGNVYGGGDNNSHITEHTTVTIKGKATVDKDVYGGGILDSDVKGAQGTTVNIEGTSTVKENVYGGGTINSNVTNAQANAHVTVAKEATVMQSVYGGGYTDSTIAKATIVDIYGTIVGTDRTKNNVFGGGRENSPINAVNKDSGATVTLYSTAHVAGNVFGGGRKASPVEGKLGTVVDVKTGALVGETNIFYEIQPSYKSYPTYDENSLNNEYPVIGNVYGGGTAGGAVAGNFADASPVSHVAGAGSKVTIEKGAHASGVIYGGGFQSDIIGSTGGAVVNIYGSVGAVHGGGRQGRVADETRDGTIVRVTGPDAYVRYDVYGGGYSESKTGIDTQVRKTKVTIDNKANVRERVFGGGHGPGAEILENTHVDITDLGTYIGNKALLDNPQDYPNLNQSVTGLNGNTASRKDNRKYFEFYNRYTALDGPIEGGSVKASESFNALGQVYGGGNNADVGEGTNIRIDNNHTHTGQKVYDRISGGNLGLESDNTKPRIIDLVDFGSGDYTTEHTYAETPYCPVEKFSTIRFLQDYTQANADNSYLTVYYNLNSYDDGNSLFGGAYPADHKGTYIHSKGIYHPWRPAPNTSVTVEPIVRMNLNSKFRVRSGYTITLENGLFSDDPSQYAKYVSLWIDLNDQDGSVASTTKIYSTPDNVTKSNIFRYQELPRTLFPKNILHTDNYYIHGVNFYIPPRNIEHEGGPSTDQGGHGKGDTGTGYAGGGGFGGGFAGGGGAASARPSVTSKVEYLLSDTTVVNQDNLVSRTTDAVKKATAGSTAIVKETAAGQIAGDTLRAMQKAALAGGKTVRYYGDTVRKPNIVEGRMYINPALAGEITGVISTGVYTHTSKFASTALLFDKFFKNDVAIVHLAHKGNLGMAVEIAAKVDLKDLDLKNLLFYSYDTETNAYTQIAKPNYFVDNNGYLHFTTTVGGDIIITDKVLERK